MSYTNAFSNLQTPLHLAAREGYRKCIRTLLEHGAQNVPNKKKETPSYLVTGKEQCEKEFQYYIAKTSIPRRSKEQKEIVNGKEGFQDKISWESSLAHYIKAWVKHFTAGYTSLYWLVMFLNGEM